MRLSPAWAGASSLPATPKLLWSFEAESEPTSPVVMGDRVVGGDPGWRLGRA